MTQTTSRRFKSNAAHALLDADLQAALANIETGFQARRAEAIARVADFEGLRDAARDIKDHTLGHLGFYLERFEGQVLNQGGHVHWCRTADEACAAVLSVCRAAGARRPVKSKSMVSEEIGLNAYLEANGLDPVETDLGEYIIQLRREAPSHIIAPALHLTEGRIAATFREQHRELPPARALDNADLLLAEARRILRGEFLAADVGITGANFLVAETGTAVIVTNEGNADLAHILPPVHIVLTSIEKLVPTLEDATTCLRLLARSATGQEQSVYTTFVSGPRREHDADGAGEFHVVLVDNGRSALLDGPFRHMLRCIKCGACLNHCPVYRSVGGHAYGWVYPGPMGAVLTPALKGAEAAGPLPFASTFCGRCDAVCPVRIPLVQLLRKWREINHAEGLSGNKLRLGLRIWGFFARRPRLYHFVSRMKMGALFLGGRRKGRFRRLLGLSAWTKGRDFPAPEGATFMAQWKARRKETGSAS